MIRPMSTTLSMLLITSMLGLTAADKHSSSEQGERERKEHSAAQSTQVCRVPLGRDGRSWNGLWIGKRREGFSRFLQSFKPGELCPRARELAIDASEEIFGWMIYRDGHYTNAELGEELGKLRNTIRMNVVAQVNLQGFTQGKQDEIMAQLFAAQERAPQVFPAPMTFAPTKAASLLGVQPSSMSSSSFSSSSSVDAQFSHNVGGGAGQEELYDER